MAQKRLVFTSKSPTSWHHSVAHALFPTHLHSFDGSIAMEEQRSSLATPTRQTNDRPEFFRTISLKTAPKRPFLDTKSAIKSAKRLKAAGNLFVVRGKPTIFVTAPKRPFLDTKSAIERAKRLKTARNLFVVMRVCSPVDLSHLDAGFEPRCGRKDFWTACLLSCCCCCYCCCCCFLLLLLKCVAHPWTLKGGVKPLEGKPRSVIKTRTMTELGPSLA